MRTNMRKIGLFLIGLCMSAAASAQNFNDYFADKTLRLDYIFTGNATRQEICLDELCSLPGWADGNTIWTNCPWKETDKWS